MFECDPCTQGYSFISNLKCHTYKKYMDKIPKGCFSVILVLIDFNLYHIKHMDKSQSDVLSVLMPFHKKLIRNIWIKCQIIKSCVWMLHSFFGCISLIVLDSQEDIVGRPDCWCQYRLFAHVRHSLPSIIGDNNVYQVTGTN